MQINSSKHDEATIVSNKKNTLLRLFHYLLSYKLEVVLVFIIMAVSVFISLLGPLIIETSIDDYIGKGDYKGLIYVSAFAIFINLLLVFLIRSRMLIMAKVSNKILLTIRQELYTHIQTLDFQFFDSRPTGKILARIIGDVNSLKDVLSNSVTTLIPDFITICSVVVIMLVKNYKLALAAMASIPLMVVGMFVIQIYSHKRWLIFRKKGSNLNAFIHEDLSGMKIVQSFTAEEETRKTFEDLLKEHRDSFIDAIRLNDAFGPIIDLSWGLGTLSLYFTGIYILGIDNISIGLLLAFGTYIGMFWHPIMNLSNFYNQLITNVSGAQRIFEIIDTPSKITDDKQVIPLPPIEGNIRFDHVSFAYDENSKVLNNMSFQVKAGETIALVGPTGAGKSTVVNLISRFYDIQDGHIYIDDYDLKQVSIESLRQQMGVMTQDNFLFTGTIKENIRYGKLDASEDEIIAAAKVVGAHDFIIHLEEGYDTVLEERGGGLSIGQKQLLAFARTMVSMPKVLILDEATSSIDTQTEILVQNGIEALLKGRTSFVIAHRLSTIQKADRIFVIDEGVIKEQGNAKELIAKKGLYYDLYMAQFKTITPDEFPDSTTPN